MRKAAFTAPLRFRLGASMSLALALLWGCGAAEGTAAAVPASGGHTAAPAPVTQPEPPANDPCTIALKANWPDGRDPNCRGDTIDAPRCSTRRPPAQVGQAWLVIVRIEDGCGGSDSTSDVLVVGSGASWHDAFVLGAFFVGRGQGGTHEVESTKPVGAAAVVIHHRQDAVVQDACRDVTEASELLTVCADLRNPRAARCAVIPIGVTHGCARHDYTDPACAEACQDESATAYSLSYSVAGDAITFDESSGNVPRRLRRLLGTHRPAELIARFARARRSR